MSRWHVSDGVLHADVVAESAAEAIEVAFEASEGELTVGSVEPSKDTPLMGLGSEAE